MGQIQEISLGIRSNPARERQAGCARLINMFAEEQESEGKSTWILYPTDGLINFGNALAGGGIRKMLPVKDKLYVVAGRLLYAIDGGGGVTELGGIPTDGPVFMRQNRRVPTQIGIVSDGLYFVLTGDVLQQIQDIDLPPPGSIAWLDGYGILPTLNGEYFITGLDEFATIDGLDAGVCEARPDEIVVVETLERDAFFLGEESAEIHTNTGEADFPFTRQQTMEIGCLAAGPVVKVDTKQLKALLFVAADHTVRQVQGYTPVVVSTNEIEALIETLDQEGRASELTATAWAAAGRFFYTLSCNDWSRTLDSKTGFWHDRKSYGQERWRVSQVVKFGNKLIAGDRETGQLYQMRSTYYDEAGDYLIREVITPAVSAYPYEIRFNAMFINITLGVGLNSAAKHEREPKLMVKWSDDDGASWSPERIVDLHKDADERPYKTIINKLGTCGPKGRVFSFRISAPVRTAMMSVFADIDVLGGANAASAA
jgi:hypothetical protein